MCESKYIEEMKEALSSTDQTVLFVESDTKRLIDTCVEYLKFKGYKIVKPVECICNVKTLAELVCFFYSLLDLKHPECVNSYRNEVKDRVIAKKFIAARMNISNTNKQEALKECVQIIKTIFDYEDEFHFKYELNFNIFGQDKMGWITDKAIKIINRELKYKIESDAEIRREEMIKAQDTENLGFDNLDEILEKLEKKNNGR